MSGFRSPKSAAGSKAAGQGSTHRHTARSRAASGAKASDGSMGGNSTHESLSPDRRSKAGAKASQSGNNSIVSTRQGVSDIHGTASEQAKPKGHAVPHHHGVEMVSEHHRR